MPDSGGYSNDDRIADAASEVNREGSGGSLLGVCMDSALRRLPARRETGLALVALALVRCEVQSDDECKRKDAVEHCTTASCSIRRLVPFAGRLPAALFGRYLGGRHCELFALQAGFGQHEIEDEADDNRGYWGAGHLKVEPECGSEERVPCTDNKADRP